MSSKGSIWVENDGSLHIRQGRYGELTVPLTNADKTVYTMDPTDILKLTIRASGRISEDTPPILLQEISVGSNILSFEAEDTALLPPGKYKFDATLYQLGTKPIPVIDPNTVYIEEVIT